MVGRRHFSEDQIEAALRTCGGIQSRAACALANAAGISFTRQALNKAIKKSKRLQRACEDIVEETLDLAEDKCIDGIRNGDSSLIKILPRDARQGARLHEASGTDWYKCRLSLGYGFSFRHARFESGETTQY